MTMAPGRPFDAGEDSVEHPGAADRMRAIYGADRPILDRYVAWVGAFAQLDLGVSYSYRRPVADLLGESLGNTALLAGAAIALQFTIGVVVGALAARRRKGVVDSLVTWTAALVYSIPSYWIGLVLVWIASVTLRWLPASQMHALDAAGSGPARILDSVRHLILPCLALTLPTGAGIVLFLREEMRSALALPCVRAARARGVSEPRIVWRHALGNALVPLTTLFGLGLPALAGGSVVVEVLFAWPGMGRLLYQAVLARDLPLILGGTGVVSVMVVLGSLAADILAAAIDPRVRDATA